MIGTLKRRHSQTLSGDNSVTTEKTKEFSETSQSSSTAEELRDEQQRKVFANLRLKRIIKENHGSDIQQIGFFFNNRKFDGPVGLEVNKTFDKRGSVQREQHDTSNILASVGGTQVSVYDNEHCGDHLDIMSNFNLASKLKDDQEKSQKLLSTFCWVHENDDALVATGGIEGNIHILSIAYSKEIAVLKGHTKRIVDLHNHPRNDKQILSISKDGTMRLWDVTTQKCIVRFDYECNVACFHPSGNTFITGNTKGELREWTIPAYITPMDDDEDDIMTVGKANSRILKKMHGDSTIDCIRYAKGDLLTKSINGRLELWNPETEEHIRSFRVKTGENHSRFDISLDGKYICVGTSQGTIFIYDLRTGKVLAELSHRRSTKAVRCCIFTRDCRQVLCGGEEGFIWRYDYIDDSTLELWKQWTKS